MPVPVIWACTIIGAPVGEIINRLQRFFGTLPPYSTVTDFARLRG